MRQGYAEGATPFADAGGTWPRSAPSDRSAVLRRASTPWSGDDEFEFSTVRPVPQRGATVVDRVLNRPVRTGSAASVDDSLTVNTCGQGLEDLRLTGAAAPSSEGATWTRGVRWVWSEMAWCCSLRSVSHHDGALRPERGFYVDPSVVGGLSVLITVPSRVGSCGGVPEGNAAKLAGVNDLTASHSHRSVLHEMILARA